MAFTAGLKTIVAVSTVVALMAAGCGAADTGAEQATTTSATSTDSPTTASTGISQPELQPGFVAELDPVGALRAGIYALLRAPSGDSIGITGYRQKIAPDGATAKTTVLAFNPTSGGWEPQTDVQLVWSPSQGAWVESDLAQAISVGPTGSRGLPTVQGVTDAATSFDTLSYRDLAGLALADGLQKEFSNGLALPQSLQGSVFSPGARAYLVTSTTVDPTYAVRKFANPKTRVEARPVVYACGQPSPGCTTPASSIAMASQEGGQFINPSGTAMLTLTSDGHAVLRPVATELPSTTYTYRIVDVDGPRRMIFAASNPDDAKQFGRATGISVDNFAVFEYDGQVTIGIAQPASKTVSLFAGYDQVAANDLLTHWSPAMPAVLP
jgi:hypothetical protein